MREQQRINWPVIAWSIFFVFFVGAGAVPFDKLLRSPRVKGYGPENSSDTQHWNNLILANGSRRIEECLATVPDGGKLAIVSRRGDRHDLNGQLIALAAWRRGLPMVSLSSSDADIQAQTERHAPAAVFWLGPKKPSWMQGAQQLSPGCAFVLYARK